MRKLSSSVRSAGLQTADLLIPCDEDSRPARGGHAAAHGRGATARAILICLLFAYFVGLYGLALSRDLQRGPHIDEIEHLHVAVLMSRGLRPYVDFFEHHPPLFWALLLPFVPDEPSGTGAIEALMIRARLLSGAMVAIVLACCALILHRASGRWWVVAVFVGLTFSAGGIWGNGLGDIRPDSTALAVWWIGAALVLLARSGWIRGLGIGIVLVASMVKPQWPLTSVILGLVLLADLIRDRPELLRATIAGSAVSLAGLAATAGLADPAAVFFHVIVRTAAMIDVVFAPELTVAHRPWYGCPTSLQPWILLTGGAVVVAALLRTPSAFRNRRLVLCLLLLALGSLIEIRFVYPFPAVDMRYYAYWVVVASAVLAMFASAAASLVGSKTLQRCIQLSTLAFVAFLATDIVGEIRPQPDRYWRHSRWMEAQLREGETVWNEGSPIHAPDASYYWFGIDGQIIPLSIEAARTPEGERYLPPITEEELPPCRVERGLDTKVRLMTEPSPRTLPVAAACFERLRRSGRIYREPPFTETWVVRRQNEPPV